MNKVLQLSDHKTLAGASHSFSQRDQLPWWSTRINKICLQAEEVVQGDARTE